MDLSQQQNKMVERYKAMGYIKTQEVEKAMLAVPREEFMGSEYRTYAYNDIPALIPGDGRQTISAPYMYPVTYESLKIKNGDRFLEVGAGSGYGAALAQEIVGESGLVVTIEINQDTYSFAKSNLERTGYKKVKLIHGDGSLGYLEDAPYDNISVTAATPDFPKPLIDQLKAPGRMISPVGPPYYYGQELTLLEKDEDGKFKRKALMNVVYVPLLGEYGWKKQ